jgi:hypothetical protein
MESSSLFTRSLAVALMAASGACAMPASEAGTCEPAGTRAALLADNGMSLNGLSLNGASFGGTDAWNNGTALRGQTLHGITLEHASFATAGVASLSFHDGRLWALDASGAPLPADALVGTRIFGVTELGEPLVLAIAGVDVSDEGGLVAYDLALAGGESLCGSSEGGTLLPGIWSESGARVDAIERDGMRFDMTLSCAPGVLAKCARWGYAPWVAGDQAHQTCTRLARADYCGDGVPHTRDGTPIDVFDVEGLVAPSEDAGAMSFEAGWGPDGAVCVSHPRHVTIADGIERLPSCFSDLPRCDGWDDAVAEGALLGNASEPVVHRVCGE